MSKKETMGKSIGSGRIAYDVKDQQDRPTIITCPNCGWQHSSMHGHHNCEESQKHV